MNKERVVTPEKMFPEVPEKIFLFRSCTGSMEYPGTENAIKEVMKSLGIEIVMDPDQTCCSGYLLTCSAYKPEFSWRHGPQPVYRREARADTHMFCNGCMGYNLEPAHIT